MESIGTAGITRRPTPWLDMDLSMAQWKALLVLHNLGAARAGEVAAALNLSPNATTAVLDRLEEEGLSSRQPDPSDRRAVLAALTPKGVGWVTDLLTANVRAYGEVLEELSVTDLEALRQGMVALRTVLRARDAQREPALPTASR